MSIYIEEFVAMESFGNLVKIDTKWAYYTSFKGNLSRIRSHLDYGFCSKFFRTVGPCFIDALSLDITSITTYYYFYLP